jgi:RNA polymerase sigma-70 factor (ECF subfamily)
MTVLAMQPEPLAAEATRQLFETHRQRIFGFCLSQLGNHHDAEDAVQTTFLYAFGCLERGVVPEAELAWLFKIALNVCRTRRRSLGRRRRVEAPTDFDACEYAFAAPERGDDQLLGLSGALAAMPANQRNALLLREWQGLSYAEIAERLTISQSAVETLLFRARRTLGSQLSRIPQRVAVMVNLPVLLRLVRRLVPSAGAVKTTAAIVAVGAVSTVGGRELEHSFSKPAVAQPRSSRHSPTRVHTALNLHRHVSLVPASRGRAPQPQRTEALSTAEAAAPTSAESGAPLPAASAPASALESTPQPAAPAASATTTTAAPISLPATTPALPIEQPAATAGALVGSVTSTVTTTATTVVVTSAVPQVTVPDPTQLLPLP